MRAMRSPAPQRQRDGGRGAARRCFVVFVRMCERATEESLPPAVGPSSSPRHLVAVEVDDRVGDLDLGCNVCFIWCTRKVHAWDKQWG